MPRSPLSRSREQEKDGAALYGGSRNVMSGAGWTRKNDVRTDDLSIEYKFTGKTQYVLKIRDLLEAEKHAVLDDRMAMFGLRFLYRGKSYDYVVLSQDDFLSLLHTSGGGGPDGDAPEDPVT